MKIALKNQGDGWIIDNMVNDFIKYSRHQAVGINDNPDILWSVNLFAFPEIRKSIPSSCISLVQVHHIDETKLKEYDFKEYNKANGCIVPNEITKRIASKYLSIPIYQLPYWLSSIFLKERDEQKISEMKRKINPEGHILIGSFVKDGEGKMGDKPKLSKGTDIFVKILEKISTASNIKVVLGGYGRNYVVRNLEKLNIPYIYLERYNDINLLYDCLDWYISASRVEGGPQSILESSYRRVKILSSNCGMVSEVLHKDCICNDIDDFVDKFNKRIDRVEYNYNTIINKYMPQMVIKKYDDFFEGIKSE
jgi:hypothetical protein